MLELDFSSSEAVSAVLCCSVAYLYHSSRHWVANNAFGIAFSVIGIKLLSPGSFTNAAILLCGLFVYDVFWVFGTDVMVTVAKSFTAPIKLLFIRDWAAPPEKMFSLLGLGDIVIPGIFVAMTLRFQKHGKSLFVWTLIGYVLGLVATVAVMLMFNAAQPALLYLVPSCLLSSCAGAWSKGALPQWIAYSEEEEEHKEEPKNKQK